MVYCSENCVNKDQDGRCSIHKYNSYNIYGTNCSYYHEGTSMAPFTDLDLHGEVVTNPDADDINSVDILTGAVLDTDTYPVVEE